MSKQVQGYSCNICGKYSGDLTKAKAHMEAKHFPSSTGYTCQCCDRWFKTKNALSIHMSREHRDRMWKCFNGVERTMNHLLQGNWTLLRTCSTSVRRGRVRWPDGRAACATSLLTEVGRMCATTLKVATIPMLFNTPAPPATRCATQWGPWKYTSPMCTVQVFESQLCGKCDNKIAIIELNSLICARHPIQSP